MWPPKWNRRKIFFFHTMKVSLGLTKEMRGEVIWVTQWVTQFTYTQALPTASPQLILVPFVQQFLQFLYVLPVSAAKNYTDADVDGIEFHRGRFSLCTPASINVSKLQHALWNKHYLKDGGFAWAKQLLSFSRSAVSCDLAGLFASLAATASFTRWWFYHLLEPLGKITK